MKFSLKICLGSGPGLVLIGGDSCQRGHEFESPCHKQDGSFFTFMCCKNCAYRCLMRPKINKKTQEIVHFNKRGRISFVDELLRKKLNNGSFVSPFKKTTKSKLINRRGHIFLRKVSKNGSSFLQLEK